MRAVFRWLLAQPRRLLLGAALLVATTFTLVMASLPQSAFLAHTASDDAFYYLTIARHAGEAGWPTFDGAHTTTGFHPLWLFLLVPLAKTVGAPFALARVAVALSAALMCVAALLFGRVTRRAFGPTAGVLAATVLLASAGTLRFGLMAMEGPLELVFLALFLQEQIVGRGRPMVAGALAGLAILARLDAAIVVAAAVALPVWRQRSWPGLARAAKTLGATGALVVPYLAWNVWLSGHLTTISSATKSYVATLPHDTGLLAEAVRVGGEVLRISPASVIAGPIAVAGGDYPSAVNTSDYTFSIVAVAVALAILAGWAAAPLVWTSQRDPEFRSAVSSDLVVVLMVSSVCHLALACVVLPGQSGPWYWGLEAATIAVLLGGAYARWRVCRMAVAGLAFASVLGSAMIVASVAAGLARGTLEARRSFGSEMLASAEDLAGTEEAIGSCNAGMLGFFHGGRVVNLDGLVNDWSYLAARREGPPAVRAWIARAGIRWIADCVPADGIDSYARSLGLDRTRVVVAEQRDIPACRAFVWRLDDDAETQVAARVGDGHLGTPR